MPYSGTKIIALYDDNGNGFVIHGVQLADISFVDKNESENDITVSVYSADNRYFASIAKRKLTPNSEISSRKLFSEKSLKKLSKRLKKHFKHVEIPDSLHKLCSVKKTAH